MKTDPAAGAVNPRTTLSSVDFPQPLAPVSATISPGATVSDTPSSAGAARPA